ncbi:S1C family serine protease [Actinomadura scrupuli]|uniref:S1C family serine protease n=1 Tax=Actinomadura scrupuli TaxID=559629 RepID=UPI003D986AF0
MHRTSKLRAGVAVLAVLAPLSGCGAPADRVRQAGTTASPSPAAGGGVADQLQTRYEQVVQTVLPSVVQITTEQGEGSGVVYDNQGDIVTNAHVVAGARDLQVTQANGGKPLKATLVGTFSADDLAVIKVTGGSLHPARFGDSRPLRVGQIVMAMGNPLGLSGSVTQGIVSALGRTVTSKPEGAFRGATIADAIQTSAAINPGNSGGALVTLTGEVIGIPSATAVDPELGGAAQGIGFAIPSRTVNRIAPQLIKTGKVTNSGRAALGVVVRATSDNSGRPTGVGVVRVARGGPADKAGIRPGDTITAVNGAPTPSPSDLTEALARLQPGATVKVDTLRPDGTRSSVQVKLGELPNS